MLRSSATGCSGVWSAGPQGLMWLWPVCRYVQHYGLDGASDDIEHVLKRVALRLRKTRKVKVLTGTGDVNVVQPNYSAAAHDFLRTFRSGLFGPVMLDRDVLQDCPAADTDSAPTAWQMAFRTSCGQSV
ncbi:Hypothetical predicted protein [Marmota monax]|uniref:Uncharacterized protein n=1 Tax=Marmota monax TaxID=9995 RepID=A0A5E4BMQ7_MARMO|nr:Hypothetical predicted protein [Marmota monax]